MAGPSLPNAFPLPSFLWPQFATWKQDGWVASGHSHDVFMENLVNYRVNGHSYRQLRSLGEAIDVTQANISASVYVEQIDSLQPYIRLINRQTLLPTSLTVYYSDGAMGPTIEAVLKQQVTVPWSSEPIANRYAWLAALVSRTHNMLWILDMPHPQDIDSIPAHQLEYVYRTSQLVHYKQALLGTRAALLPANLNPDRTTQTHCLPSPDLPPVTQPADLLLDAWLLKKEWFLSLETLLHSYDGSADQLFSLPYLISQALRRQPASSVSIPTIALPWRKSDLVSPPLSCADALQQFQQDPSWLKQKALRSSPTALDHRQIALTRHRYPSVVYLIETAHQATALIPLLCRPQQYLVHVLVAGSKAGLSSTVLERSFMSLDAMECLGRSMVTIHDLDIPTDPHHAFADHALPLIHVLQPQVVLHTHAPHTHLAQLLASLSSSVPWIVLQLPQDQIRHALWLPDLTLEALKHWNDISIQLVVITDRRPHSLSRLLYSCSHGVFFGDKVDLTINMEQSADQVTQSLVTSFEWGHGEKILRHRVQKGGLMPAIVESWYPRHNHDYGVLLEDDISLSPLFYVWAKYNILKYRYGPDRHHPQAHRIYGVSLYSPRNVELHLVGRRPFDPTLVLYNSSYAPRTPYASQVPCSWGAVYFPEHWREYHTFLSAQLDDLMHDHVLNISLPMSRSDRWKKSWKKYFIQLVYLRGYVMIYPNYQDFASFATNHLETGTHVKSEKRQRIIESFLVPLMQKDTLLTELPGQHLPDFKDMPVLDLWGKLVSHDILTARADRWHARVSACQRQEGVFDASDLLCPFSLIPEWLRKGYKPPYKKIKPISMVEVVEPVTYTTITIAHNLGDTEEEADDWPWRLDPAIMNPVVDDIPVYDDELQDFLSSIGQLSSPWTT
ncbi:hypothetical protein DM01DRAFT_1334780 [Hesseltinella vesiculosa]|uniref:Uncharacterized protein n=1 Tax=Hesseltinella vesiculosa TaxID=101127 RepID=A0A1X2GL41_9FUNG|nr:hypothetical protein DM01DRAFT_1334780 [Hesseltinella vesiculosa]